MISLEQLSKGFNPLKYNVIILFLQKKKQKPKIYKLQR